MKSRAILTDTRTCAELWLNGEGVAKRDRLHRLAEKRGGAYRQILVRLADGFEITTGSYIRDDLEAAAAAIRYARSRAMEAVFAADAELARAEKRPPQHAWRWVHTPDGQIRTRACSVAAVFSVTDEGGRDLWPEERKAWAPSKKKRPTGRYLFHPMTGERIHVALKEVG